ncbi:MAG: hypothetical protein JEY99_03250 [Spirochaetales bacterium]|nr:hypothetical protein [Spirochaetales bacterium]
MKIPVPRSGGLILSYKCTAECRHCMYGCSPKWSADWISDKNLDKTLKQLSRTITPAPEGPASMSLSRGLHFSGGEPFMNFDLLCLAVENGAEYGIPSMFVETNCFWATDDDIALEKLKILKEKGLMGIMISVNPFYLEYIPFERTERAIRLSLEVFGRNTMVYQMDYYRRFKDFGFSGKVALEDYFKYEDKHSIFSNVEFFLSGRSPYSVDAIASDLFPSYPAGTFFNSPCSPSFIRPWHNHFDNYGNYMPGYCGGISYGDCRELDSIVETEVSPEEFPVLDALMREEIGEVYVMAGELGFKEAEAGYRSKCHLCFELRRYLIEHGDFRELAPREFYTHFG